MKTRELTEDEQTILTDDTIPIKRLEKKHEPLDKEAQSLQGALAESLAADAYGYPDHDADPFDARRDTGAVLEAKSTVTRYSSGARGRFRLWKRQHSRLTRKDREDTARYVFVLFDVSERPVTARMLEKQPARIGRLIAGRGGFNQSGHPKGKQIKLPYSALFEQ